MGKPYKVDKSESEYVYILKRGTSWNKLETSEMSWNYLKLAGIIWNKLGPPGTKWNRLERDEISNKVTQKTRNS